MTREFGEQVRVKPAKGGFRRLFGSRYRGQVGTIFGSHMTRLSGSLMYQIRFSGNKFAVFFEDEIESA